jgi:predicted nucleic acid-binding protein
MKTYADTSFLARLLIHDADNASAVDAHRSLGRPFLIYTPFHRLEVTNALRLRTFMVSNGTSAIKRRAKIEEQEAERRLKWCLAKGLFQATPMPWESAIERAVELSTSHCHRIGLRSFDLFHVGAAVELQVKHFITCDLRQAALAKAAGLKVTLVKRET